MYAPPGGLTVKSVNRGEGVRGGVGPQYKHMVG